ncbi:hypothetical protein D9M69_698850 [compost metagenome]
MVADGDHDGAGFCTGVQQLAVLLLQSDPNRFASERHAHTLLNAGLAGAVRAADECNRRRELQRSGTDAEEVLDVDVGKFHAAPPNPKSLTTLATT